MARRVHAKIDGLPPETRAQAERLVLDGDATYQEIRAWLSGQGLDISLAAVGRWALRIRAARENALEARRLLEEVHASGADFGQALEVMAGQGLFEFLSKLDPAQSDDLAACVPGLIKIMAVRARLEETRLKAEKLQFERDQMLAGLARAEAEAKKQGEDLDPATVETLRKSVNLIYGI